MQFFKTDGNYEIYDGLNFWYAGLGLKDFNAMLYNQYSQLKETKRNFNLYVGAVFKCDDFFKMGKYEKKVFLFRLKGRKNEDEKGHPSFKFFEKIRKFKEHYGEKHNLLIESGYRSNFKHVYRIFTYTHFCKGEGEEEYEDEGIQLIPISKFYKLIKFLHASQYTMEYFKVDIEKQKDFFKEILKFAGCSMEKKENLNFSATPHYMEIDCSICHANDNRIFFSGLTFKVCKKCTVLSQFIHHAFYITSDNRLVKECGDPF